MLEQQPPLIDSPKSLLLKLAELNSANEVLELIVRHVAVSPTVALTRIWLVGSVSDCAICRQRHEPTNPPDALHLVASDGTSINRPDADLTRLDGDFHRFPIGERKVGRIVATGQPLEVGNLAEDVSWLARPEWAKAEGIRGFGGQPLIHHGRVMGVLAVFSRATINDDDMDWLRTIANHAAASLANASAWEEVNKLRARLEMENEYLLEEVQQASAFGEMVGSSEALHKVGQQISLVAPTDSTVLVTGESGTGKELVAREIHRRSPRRNRPLIKVNCAAIPRELYDSEFFGHTKGSFTGAVRDRVGRFELADGGTLFLDEVGEIPLDLQSKLLRVLQEQEFERVGEEKTRRVDVRVIAATNRDLQEESEAKRFRSDLYFRLSVFPIELPRLADRPDDIPLLAKHFLDQIAHRFGRQLPKLTQANVMALQRYPWPGNVRELQHVLERAMLMSPDGRLDLSLLQQTARPIAPSTPSNSKGGSQAQTILTAAQMKELERENIRKAVEACGGKISGNSGAAQLLGMKPTTLTSRLKQK